MAKDKEYNRLIHKNRWVRLRRRVLTDCPLCVRCRSEGFVTAATEVHHRIPVESAVTAAEKERLMYDPSNLVPLCHACHVKTHTEMGRGGKKATAERNAAEVKEIIGRFFGPSE